MKHTSIWDKVEPLLSHVERPSRYIGSEWGAKQLEDGCYSFCMVYPDTYELGQANQAVRILVNAVNDRDGLSAERSFLPAFDMIESMRAEDIPLFSLESCIPLKDFDVVGITLPHELAATNILEVLDLSGIPIRSKDRDDECPIVIAGGPCAFNPEPYAPFFDAILIGEGEESVPEVVECVGAMRAAHASREDILHALSRCDGVYVPSLYTVLDEETAQRVGCWIARKSDPGAQDAAGGEAGVGNGQMNELISIKKRVYDGFSESSGWECMVVPYMETVHDRLNVEILRGCARGCRFCQAGMMYRPIRERSVDNIVNAVRRGLAETGYEEVSLTSLSSTDHSQIKEILEELNRTYAGTGVRISIPSQRLDSFGVEMAHLVAGGKRGGLTFAPEAGTQRLRDVINKNVTEDDLFGALDAAMDNGWRRVKLYFMIGLPTETDDDIKGIASLAQRAYDRMKAATPSEQRGSLRMTVSVALFVPKAQTPFQWDGQISSEEALRRVGLLKRSVKYKAVQINYHEPKTSLIEAVMSRGGVQVADLLESAWRHGAKFDAWTEFFNEEAWKAAARETGIDFESIAQITYPTSYILPWEHISCGVSRTYLADERKRAEAGITTEDCTFGTCTSCGVCPALKSSNSLQARRSNAAAARDGSCEGECDREDEHEGVREGIGK